MLLLKPYKFWDTPDMMIAFVMPTWCHIEDGPGSAPCPLQVFLDIGASSAWQNRSLYKGLSRRLQRHLR